MSTSFSVISDGQQQESPRLSTYTTNSQRIDIVHRTLYKYSAPVTMSKHSFRLTPVHDLQQSILHHNITLSIDAVCEQYGDVFGNSVHFLNNKKLFTEFEVLMEATVNVNEIPPPQPTTLHYRTTIPLTWMPWQRQMMMAYLLPPELPESQLSLLSDYAMSFVQRNDYDVVAVLNDINQTLFNEYLYYPRSTTLETTAFDVFVQKRGVCQDFANLFICLARILSIPARYRMGYLITDPDTQNQIQSEASHAWLEVYLPWEGWRGYDPTNGCLVGTNHVRVACGRNYFDATPTSGTIYDNTNNTEELFVDVKVTPSI